MSESVLSEAARVLPPSGQKIWIKAFKEGKQRGMPEDEASAYAWTAVKRAGYHRTAGGKWGKSMDAELLIDGDNFTLGVPIVKINTEKRIVEGFATLDNVDKSGDIVDFDASVEAFKEWPGNIREMHQKNAVGKAIEIMEKKYTDGDGNKYNGIWIKARVSKGAEDTWQKVLDGTLSGFSIGGATQEKQRELVKTADGERECWRITKYRLGEVSLVDNPCNSLASVSLVKSVDDALVIEDVLDSEEALDKAHKEGANECCSVEVENAIKALHAWRQRAIDSEQDYLVSTVSDLMGRVRSYKRMEEYEHKYAEECDKSIDNLTDEKEEVMSKTEEVLHNNENNGISESSELTEEDKSLFRKFVEFLKGEAVTSEEVSEEVVKEDEPDMNEELVKETIGNAVEEVSKSVDEKFATVGEALEKISQLLEKSASAESLAEFKTAVEAALEEVKGRVEALETTGAVKKSAEDAGEHESLEKSDDSGLWSGNIVPEFLRKQMEF